MKFLSFRGSVTLSVMSSSTVLGISIVALSAFIGTSCAYGGMGGGGGYGGGGGGGYGGGGGGGDDEGWLDVGKLDWGPISPVPYWPLPFLPPAWPLFPNRDFAYGYYPFPYTWGFPGYSRGFYGGGGFGRGLGGGGGYGGGGGGYGR